MFLHNRHRYKLIHRHVIDQITIQLDNFMIARNVVNHWVHK